jgi:hypothetical protein
MTIDPTDQRPEDHGELTPDQHHRLVEACVLITMASDGDFPVPEYTARAALAGEPPPVLAAMLPDSIDECKARGVDFDPLTGEAWEE